MEYLTPEQLQELKQLLLLRKREISQRLEEFVKRQLTQPEEIGDEIDHAEREVERLKAIRLRERESRYLKKVEYALQKIQEGTYGICEACGKPISYERLKARPVAVYCIECKIKLEELEED